ncbi:YqiA/YcfP family alpha/beta fold hydrolase, partial [Pseudomonas syringae group genomosp. 7]|uniref:YqiA/YcfP family alpha/beta fold hydrolase n=1 Tax=Pseudomonas syringae group genomosp. 7 TaxID=251699 RepID=UPI00376F7786
TLDYRRAELFYRACALRIQAGVDHSFQVFAGHLPALLGFAGFAPDLLQKIDQSAL